MSSVFGNHIKVSIFGQSHSKAVGVTLEGLPAGFPVDMEKLQEFLDRRAPGRGEFSTRRREEDRPEFLSGLVNGMTCGAPLTAVIRNGDCIASDYDDMKRSPRPSHADFTAHMKYGGHEDFRGGGHFSGRLTAPLCVAGGICKQFLAKEGVNITASILEMGGDREHPFDAVKKAMEQGDSAGGIISCVAEGLPIGIGEPMFDGLENKISQAVFAIPGVKGIEFGRGFEAARLRGSENNDPFVIEDGKIRTKTNNSGGILGGISSGMPLTFNVAVKPTPSVSAAQETVDYERKVPVILKIRGRHDASIVPRAVPCVEAAAAIAICDLWFEAAGKGEIRRV